MYTGTHCALAYLFFPASLCLSATVTGCSLALFLSACIHWQSQSMYSCFIVRNSIILRSVITFCSCYVKEADKKSGGVAFGHKVTFDLLSFPHMAIGHDCLRLNILVESNWISVFFRSNNHFRHQNLSVDALNSQASLQGDSIVSGDDASKCVDG